MLYAAPGASFEAVAENAPTGLTGTIGARIIDGQGTTTTPRATTGIVESPAGSGIYTATLTAPTTRGQYSVVFDTGGASPAFATEELAVTYTAPAPSAPAGPGYFTPAEFRDRYPDLNDADYPDETVDEYRQLAEQAFEDAAGVAFVPRTATTVVYARSRQQAITLPPRLRTVTAVTVDGTAYTTDQLDALRIDSGILYAGSQCGWLGDITVEYEHGYDAPPLRVKQAVMALTRAWMVDGPVTARATQRLDTESGGSINLATPGFFGSEFGLPDVDQTLRQYAIRTFVA